MPGRERPRRRGGRPHRRWSTGTAASAGRATPRRPSRRSGSASRCSRPRSARGWRRRTRVRSWRLPCGCCARGARLRRPAHRRQPRLSPPGRATAAGRRATRRPLVRGRGATGPPGWRGAGWSMPSRTARPRVARHLGADRAVRRPVPPRIPERRRRPMPRPTRAWRPRVLSPVFLRRRTAGTETTIHPHPSPPLGRSVASAPAVLLDEGHPFVVGRERDACRRFSAPSHALDPGGTSVHSCSFTETWTAIRAG